MRSITETDIPNKYKGQTLKQYFQSDVTKNGRPTQRGLAWHRASDSWLVEFVHRQEWGRQAPTGTGVDCSVGELEELESVVGVVVVGSGLRAAVIPTGVGL